MHETASFLRERENGSAAIVNFSRAKTKGAAYCVFATENCSCGEELRSESSGTAALISSHLPSLEECMRTTSEYFSIQLFIILERTNREHVELWTYLVTEHTLGRHFIVMCFNALYLESFSSSSVFNDFAFAFVLLFPSNKFDSLQL